jgi:hypothetical protein
MRGVVSLRMVLFWLAQKISVFMRFGDLGRVGRSLIKMSREWGREESSYHRGFHA